MTQELLFTFRNVNQWHPVTLVTYDSGDQDLVIQTGPGHAQALEDAKVLLSFRGLTVSEEGTMLGGAGMYYTVTKENK